MSDDADDQLALVPAPPVRARKAKAVEVASVDPVARVIVDTGLAHLDRPFDYLVPAELDDRIVPGCRVRVRFAGQLVDGFVIERRAESDHEGTLAVVSKAVSPEPVLAPQILTLARAVADRYAGTVGDVLRSAVPPRHAATERKTSRACSVPDVGVDVAAWEEYPAGTELIGALQDGSSPRAAMAVLPRPGPDRLIAGAVLATLKSGRGAIVCVPDVRDVERWRPTFADVLGDAFVVLTSAQSPAERYASFLAVSRGAAKVVLGTRAAAFAPVHDLGLLALWDDGDDLYAEPRAPYQHTRDVMLLRAQQHDCGVILASYARSAEVQSLVESGWCIDLEPALAARRAGWPRVEITDGADSGGIPVRLPRQVFARVRDSQGPVLIQVPRRGYRAALVCQTCRAPARCPECEGPLMQPAAGAAPTCRWCGHTQDPWACRACSGRTLRAPVVGQLRTAEEIAQAFRDHAVVTSGGDRILDAAPEGRVIVLATPGAEPPAPGGYEVIVLLDTWLMLARDDIRVAEESHRRWFNALALGRPRSRAVVVGDSSALQALVRADPVGSARRELAERRETRMPPIGRLASVEGPTDVVHALAAREWTANTDVLGPVPVRLRDEQGARLVLRAPRREGAELAGLLAAVTAERSAAKLPGVRVQVDPQRF